MHGIIILHVELKELLEIEYVVLTTFILFFSENASVVSLKVNILPLQMQLTQIHHTRNTLLQ